MEEDRRQLCKGKDDFQQKQMYCKILAKTAFEFINDNDETRQLFENKLIFIDTLLISQVVERYARDISKIKCYHPYIKDENEFKMAEYITHYISKIKPITVLFSQIEESKLNKELMYINERFALRLSFALIVNYLNKKILSLVGERYKKLAYINMTNDTFNEDFIDEFLYSLSNRHMSGYDVSIVYRSLAKGIISGFSHGFSDKHKV